MEDNGEASCLIKYVEPGVKIGDTEDIHVWGRNKADMWNK